MISNNKILMLLVVLVVAISSTVCSAEEVGETIPQISAAIASASEKAKTEVDIVNTKEESKEATGCVCDKAELDQVEPANVNEKPVKKSGASKKSDKKVKVISLEIPFDENEEDTIEPLIAEKVTEKFATKKSQSKKSKKNSEAVVSVKEVDENPEEVQEESEEAIVATPNKESKRKESYKEKASKKESKSEQKRSKRDVKGRWKKSRKGKGRK